MSIQPLETYCPIRWQALNNAQAIAVCSDQEQLSYQALDWRLTLLQEQLTQQIKTDTQPIKLVCIATNNIELLILQLLCIRVGWIFCPLNPRFTTSEIEQRLQVLKSENCWVCAKSAPQHRANNRLTLDFNKQQDAQQVADTEININPKQACNIIFTSGSTGFPKAIVHHYQNHYYSAIGSSQLIPLQQGDHNLLSLPLFHIGGYATVIRTMLAGACLHLTQQSLSVVLLQQRQVSHLSLVNTQLIRLLKESDFNKQHCFLKHILLGGSAFAPTLLDALTERQLTYHLSYGCTEMSSQVATSMNSEHLQLLKYREIKVIQGEIYLRGKTRFMGLCEDGQIKTVAEQQWISCGDLGRLEKNYLQVLGRKDRLFISGGENIQPEEIERLCLQQTQVKQVYLHPIKHDSYGQSAALFVELAEPTKASFDKQVNQLDLFLRSQLSSYKVPKIYLPWPTPQANNQALKVPKQLFLDTLKDLKLL